MSIRNPSPRGGRAASLVPRAKVWLETEGGTYVFGLGMSTILQAVERAGAIKQAAADLGKSYRHVWSRIKEAERALGRPLVETRVGGQGTRRSDLTPEARRLVTAFLAFRSRLLRRLPHEFGRCFG